jgi:hypothetical protein
MWSNTGTPESANDATNIRIPVSREGQQMNEISRRMKRSRPTAISVANLHSLAKLRLPGFNAFHLHAQRDERTRELNLSATQVLMAMATGLCLMGPLVWVIIRFWLFAV